MRKDDMSFISLTSIRLPYICSSRMLFPMKSNCRHHESLRSQLRKSVTGIRDSTL